MGLLQTTCNYESFNRVVISHYKPLLLLDIGIFKHLQLPFSCWLHLPKSHNTFFIPTKLLHQNEIPKFCPTFKIIGFQLSLTYAAALDYWLFTGCLTGIVNNSMEYSTGAYIPSSSNSFIWIKIQFSFTRWHPVNVDWSRNIILYPIGSEISKTQRIITDIWYEQLL